MTLPSSYHKANNADDGPFRNVVRTETLDNGNVAEVLACGHRGKVFYPTQVYTGKRRRCWYCRPQPCAECGHERSEHLVGMTGPTGRCNHDADYGPDETDRVVRYGGCGCDEYVSGNAPLVAFKEAT